MTMVHPGAPSWKVRLSKVAPKYSVITGLDLTSQDSRDKRIPRSTIEVELGEPNRLLRFAELAAAPSVGIIDGGHLLRVAVRAPGANPDNTEVRWDDPSKQLLVGVWRGRKPQLGSRAPFRPAELAWFHGVYLPECEGRGAQAHVARGTVTIELPKTTSARASWKPLELDAPGTGCALHTGAFFQRPRMAGVREPGPRSLSWAS
jgi:hypothetical protein